MGTRENKVEKYLKSRIKEIGGISRKWVSPGHDGVTDQIVVRCGVVYFVEVKTNDGKVSELQVREQIRLADAGMKVCNVFGEQGVDAFLDFITNSPWPVPSEILRF